MTVEQILDDLVGNCTRRAADLREAARITQEGPQNEKARAYAKALLAKADTLDTVVTWAVHKKAQARKEAER